MRSQVHARPPVGSGFTLIELMLVVTILAIIVAMALPSFLNSRMAANEASAISSMHLMVTVNEQYRVRFGSYSSTLPNMVTAGYIDDNLGDGAKAGYNFGYTGSGTNYSFTGDPQNPGVSGYRYFFVDASGVIRFSTTGTATAASPAVGN